MGMCSDIERMRPLNLYLGNRTFTLSAADLFERVELSWVSQYSKKPMCGLLVSVAPKGYRETWIVGDVFLRRVVTVFDFNRRRVGFGEPLLKKTFELWGVPSSAFYRSAAASS